jgi:hypothetical protein
VPVIVVKLATAAAAAAAAVAARQAVEYGWRKTRGDDPPRATDGVRDDAELRDVLLWSAVLAGSVLVARKLATDTTQKLLGDDRAA